MKRFSGRWTPLTSFDHTVSLRHGKEADQSFKLGDTMVLVPVSLDYVRQLQPDRIAVFDYADKLIPLVRQAGFGLVIVEGQGVKKIIAVGRKSDLVGKARAWKQPYTPHLGFEPETAMTTGGWFANYAASLPRSKG